MFTVIVVVPKIFGAMAAQKKEVERGLIGN